MYANDTAIDTKTFTANVHNSGKITIPIEQRGILDIIDGDKVTVRILNVYKTKSET